MAESKSAIRSASCAGIKYGAGSKLSRLLDLEVRVEIVKQKGRWQTV
ncbi:MAG: hypothetical protein KC777_29445 [Cyanobacteria bacterium HKST-UBA02]|nr:hypothetical protein [Cyanobacteria bacterium HKST-UBA02]